MSEFEYDVQYIPGDSKSLDTADCLSRLIRMDDDPDPEKRAESGRWQYANCWTEVYSKLFDRLSTEISTIIASAAQGADSDDVSHVHTVNTDTGATPEGGGECPDGWYPALEVHGSDNLCDIDYYVDVVTHLKSAHVYLLERWSRS